MTKQYFPEVGKIKFEGKESKNPLAYHYYDADRVVMGKPMKEWLKFAMCWWHTLCSECSDQFCPGTKTFPWNAAADPVQAAKDKADAGFEILQKLGIEPGGVTPDGKFSLEETRCLGCCALAPGMTVNGEVHGRLVPDDVDRSLDNLKDDND